MKNKQSKLGVERGATLLRAARLTARPAVFAAAFAAGTAGTFDPAARADDVVIDDTHLSHDTEAEQVESDNDLFSVTSKTIRLRPHAPTEPLSPAPLAIPPGWPADAPPPAWSAWSRYVFKEVNPAGPLKHANVSGNLFGGNIVPLMDSATVVKVKVARMKLEELQNADSDSFDVTGVIESKRTAPPVGVGGPGRGRKPVPPVEQTYDKDWNVKVKYPRFDMTVDADNSGEIGGNDHTKQNTAPSKYVPVNDTDGDHDGIPGFVQLTTPDLPLTPVRLRVNSVVNLANSKITFRCASASPLLAVGGLQTVYAPTGKVRLWKSGGARTAAELIVPGTAYPAKELIEKGIFIEGVAASATAADIEIAAEFNGHTVGGKHFSMKDKARITTYKVDVDMDSDNDDTLTASAYNLEDQKEAKAGEPGKILPVDDTDGDDDGRPGFADGYPFANAAQNDAPAADQKFTQLKVKLSDALDLDTVRLRFTYAASDPKDVERSGQDPYFTYRPAPGSLRVWTKDGTAARKKESTVASGHFVKPGMLLTPAQANMRGRTATLFIEGIRASDATGDLPIKVEILPTGDVVGGKHFDEVRMTAIGGAIIPDWNRDGVIDEDDRYKVTVKNPWRWWVNDDTDEGEIASGSSDVPKSQNEPTWGFLNFFDNKVNGLCDLPDFFVVWLDIGMTKAVLPPSASVKYRLRHATGGLKCVYSQKGPSEAGSYLRKDDPSFFGPTFNHAAKDAPSVEISAAGLEIPRVVLNNGQGVLLMEVAKKSSSPLVLEVVKDGKVVLKRELALSTDGVEQMYRWMNLRGVRDMDPQNPRPLGSVKDADRTGEPTNRPDRLTTGKHFVFVHGYNVSETGARAWGAEMFKRLYQSGMNAKFTMVTWRSDTSKLREDLPTPDYWENVTNAFITSPQLAAEVNRLSGTKIMAAHSLGNMVVSSAITDQNQGLNVAQYFMLDAAVAQEAYDGDQAYTFRHIATGASDLLCNPTWKKFNTNRARWVFANEWHRFFADTDGRRQLTWRNRFGNIPNATNYFSSGEEVLQQSNGEWPNPGATLSWVYQEMGKGRDDTWMGTIPGIDIQGGWGFNPRHNATYTTGIFNPTTQTFTTEAQAAAIPWAVLRREPFFKRFQIQDLMHPARGNAKAKEYWVRAKTLAEAIPASSQPCGSSRIDLFENRNKDLMDWTNDGWPQERYLKMPDGSTRYRWWHSDAKDVAFRYNHSLFESWVQKGELK